MTCNCSFVYVLKTMVDLYIFLFINRVFQVSSNVKAVAPVFSSIVICWVFTNTGILRVGRAVSNLCKLSSLFVSEFEVGGLTSLWTK